MRPARRRAHGSRARHLRIVCASCVQRRTSTTRALRIRSSKFWSCCFAIFASGIWPTKPRVPARSAASSLRAVPLLQLQARFDALDQHFRATLRTPSGWLSWPAEFHDPHGTAAARFAAEHPLQVEFYLYLQWLAHEQLAGAQALAVELGMPIGLYGDYAVGAHPSGAETWTDQRSYRLGAEIGAPPDQLALKGQGWGIPPPDPVQMEMQHLQGFMRLVRNNMRCYGALRLDHVMSLFRLWWVAAGYSPTQGAYVHYPLQQLLTALALESARSTLFGRRRGFGRRAGRDAPRHGPIRALPLQGVAVRKGGRPIPAPRRIRAASPRHRHDS